MEDICWNPINWLVEGCEFSNNETMILELTIAGIMAIILSVFFSWRQNILSKKIFELEHRPNLQILSTSLYQYGSFETIWEPFTFNITVKNTGLNPAIIKQVVVDYYTTKRNGFESSYLNIGEKFNPENIEGELTTGLLVNMPPMSHDKRFVSSNDVDLIVIKIKYTSKNYKKYYSVTGRYNEDDIALIFKPRK